MEHKQQQRHTRCVVGYLKMLWWTQQIEFNQTHPLTPPNVYVHTQICNRRYLGLIFSIRNSIFVVVSIV